MTESPGQPHPTPPEKLSGPEGPRLRPKPPNQPNQKMVVAIALLVCCAIAFALYASFPSRPPIRQPAIAPEGVPLADAGAQTQQR